MSLHESVLPPNRDGKALLCSRRFISIEAPETKIWYLGQPYYSFISQYPIDITYFIHCFIHVRELLQW